MPTRILIVRTSSLGDLVHMLPAISDIARHVPDAVSYTHLDVYKRQALDDLRQHGLALGAMVHFVLHT